MIGAKTSAAQCASYELEIEIDAARPIVWKALIDETNAWWLPDFHMVSPESIVTFDTQAGGAGLVEHQAGGGSLLWYSVHFFAPEQFKIYLVGHLGAEWGGPSVSHLTLSVESISETKSRLKVSDSHHGEVSEASMASLREGWLQLFREGLAKFAASR